jgi:hypothetical protein
MAAVTIAFWPCVPGGAYTTHLMKHEPYRGILSDAVSCTNSPLQEE